MINPNPKFKECSECLLQKPLDAFRIKKDNSRLGKGGYERHNGKCKDCEVKEYTKRNRQRYHLIYSYAETLGCEMCGETDVRVLVFDHIDRSTKKDSVSRLMANNRDMVVVWEEVSKCRVLCANCHSKHTSEQMNHYSHHYVSKRAEDIRREIEAKIEEEKAEGQDTVNPGITPT